MKYVLLIFFLTFHVFGYSQTSKQTQKNLNEYIGEPKEYYESYKKQIDFLSKLTGKKAVGFGIKKFENKTIFSVDYRENNRIKTLLFEAFSSKIPHSSSDRTIDSICNGIHPLFLNEID